MTKLNDCHICGQPTQNVRKLCSTQCRKSFKNLEMIKAFSGAIGTTKEILFEGNVLTIWKESDKVVFSFADPGVDISFRADDVIEAVIDDILFLAHSITHVEDSTEE